MLMPYLVALTVTLASMMELLDVTIVNVAVPNLMGSFGASVDEIAWVSTGYVVANVVILPISGWLSAYFGRRLYYMTSIAVFVLASVGCAASTALWELVACRVLQGLAGGGLLGISQAAIYDVFPKERVSTGLAVYGIGVMMGPTLGPTIGGYLIDHYSWHWIFLINVPIGAAAILLSLAFVADSQNEVKPEQIDYAGFALLAAGVGTLQILLERGEHWDWFDSVNAWACLLISGVSLVLFFWYEPRIRNPVVNTRLFLDRQFMLGSICAFCVGFGLYSTLFMVPLYLQTLMHQSPYQSGLIIFPGALASAVSTLVIGKLSQENKLDERVFITIGIGLYCYAMYLHSQFTLDNSTESFFWPLVIRGFGLGMIFVPLTNLALRRLGPTLISGASGVLNLMRQLGGSVGIAIAATMLARWSWVRYAELSTHVTEQSILRSSWSALLADPRFLTVAFESRTQGMAALPYLQTLRQSRMLAFDMLFAIFGIVMAFGIPMTLLMRRR
ncbi:DHA2 family efflux MFS transporter permease subunit [Burkholderia sp. Ac-20353]|uniref:DHA2 family efflux MFS transporter permease subunit n=1 Tax=Burkholderia sp. Ac-20353 TaxID=2703894 RepID=UPI00197B47CD|nr:DHA2 family efflux MFS transporter permease subunit [Burkholderia sp. Ac-20353]MBN3790357.1 DHA2 family efflux MFS transporter permease subunit [Burkholderia sp. Ac-20353]